MEIAVPFDKEIFENPNRKFWFNGSRPISGRGTFRQERCMVLTDLSLG